MKRPEIEHRTPPIRLVMFQFLCPLCGAKPGPRPLRPYLTKWASASVGRVMTLNDGLAQALRCYGSEQPRWTTKKFLKAVTEIPAATERVQLSLGRLSGGSTSTATVASGTGQCPVCELPSGPREPDRYFTDWRQACRVQTGNLLYEVGLILWSIVREVPTWCDAQSLADLDTLRRTLSRATKAMHGLECPICRRPTTHLYGTENRFCRWCLDMSGGFGIGIRIGDDGSVDLHQPDPTHAKFEDADLLPPKT